MLAAAPGEPDLAQLGVFGVLIAILTPVAIAWYRRETSRSDRLEEENRRLNKVVIETYEKVVPLLTAATAAVSTANEVLGELQRDRAVQALRERPRSRSGPG